MSNNTAVSLEERAYSHIRRLLLHGALRPGTPLREATLGREIGVSRTPVRHAIRQLEREGLVAQVPGFGSYVKGPDPKEIQEVAELRIVLERGAAEYAAERISLDQIAELKRVCQEMRAIAREARVAGGRRLSPALAERNNRADERFHEVIVSASGNERLMKLVRDMDLIARICSISYPMPQDVVRFLARCYREHYRIYQALRARNARLVGGRMEEHLRFAARAIIDWSSRQAASEPGAEQPHHF